MGRSSVGNFASSLQYVPLLAVLICTVGALVVLVLALARHGGQRALAAIKANAAQQSNADLVTEREGLQWKIDHLRQSRDKSQHQLADKQLELSHVEDHTRQLREQAGRLQLAIDQLENQGRSAGDEHQKAEAELARLRSAITEAEHEVRDTERSKRDQPTTYSVVPYEGPNQTKRRPIYIECRNDCVILQPEGLKFQESDFMPPLGPGNPLAAAIRAYSESLANRGLTNETTRPYPMLLVRPDGIEAYYAARSALTSWGAEFGYELVGADWTLDFPPTDATLAANLQQVVEDARMRQEALALAAPRQFKRGRSVLRASPNGGFVREEDPRGGGNGGGSGRYARRGAGSAERPFGSGGGRGSASAAGRGNSDTPGDGSGSYAGSGAYTGGGNELGGGGNSGTSGGAAFGETASAGNPGGRYSSGGGSEVGSNTGQSSGDAILGDPSGGSRYNGGTQAGQLGNASAAGGSQFGPNDTATANGGAGSSSNAGGSNKASSSSLAGGPNTGSGSTNTGGGTGTGSQQRSFGSGSQSANNSANNTKNPYGKLGSPGEGYNSNSQQANASGGGGGAPGSRSTATGANASGGSAGGNSASGGSASSSGGSSSSLGSSSSAGASGGSDASQSSPSLQVDPNQQPAASAQFEQKKKPKSLAKSRGRDWGLPEGSNAMTPMTRPVIIRCAADKLTIVPDDKRTLPVDIKLGPRTEDSVDELVDGVWTHMKGWGLAGRGLYWRPTLVMEVAPGSESRFHELQGLLADSGLEVRAREKPSTATAPTSKKRK